MTNPQDELSAARAELEPQFKALKSVIGALNTAIRLAGEERADALPMQKALTKLEEAAQPVESQLLQAAVSSFAAATQAALDDLAFAFAAELRAEFEERGVVVTGRPPVLGAGMLALNIDMAARKAQWSYGKEPLTGAIPLSLSAILKAFEQQSRQIAARKIDAGALLGELHQAWLDCLGKRKSSPAEKRINIVEAYAQLTLNRQSQRFWNAPARRTFKDYERAFFVRDLVILQEQAETSLTVDGKVHRLRLGEATKSQAGQASRSIWLPQSALDGKYYSDIKFE